MTETIVRVRTLAHDQCWKVDLMPLLEIENLSVAFPSQNGMVRAVDGVSITLEKGEVLGIVGESGSGKSVGMLALMGLVPYPGRVQADKLLFEGRDLQTLSDRERRALTGKDVAMIFQEPTTSLNPSFTIGYQLAETLQIHEGMDRKSARRRVIELLEQVGIPAAESRLQAYPHQLSGGMNQRVMIAMAIACNPKLLIADEPTTALDVTIQAQILDLLLSLQRERGMALILITHNMGVVSDTTERVAVMYAGQIMEQRPTQSLFTVAAASLFGRLAGGAPGGERRRTARHHSGRGAGTSRSAARVPVQSALRLCDAASRQGASRSAPLDGRPDPLSLSARRSDAGRTHRGRSGRRRRRQSARPCHDGAGHRHRSEAQLRGQAGLVPRAGAAAGRGRRVVRDRDRQDAGGRRRIRLRQVDAGKARDPDREAQRRHADARRRRCGRSVRPAP